MRLGTASQERESPLALPVEDQVPDVGRRARRVARISSAAVLAALLALGALASIPGYVEARWIECFELKVEERISGNVRPEWSSWPPGWTCVFETRDRLVETRYIGF